MRKLPAEVNGSLSDGGKRDTGSLPPGKETMTEYRKFSRYSVFLPVSVSVDKKNPPKVAGTVSGRILNLSRYGACVLLSRAMIDHFHFFHSFEQNDPADLQLYIQTGDNGTLKIPGRPVWFETVDLDNGKIFKIGIMFHNGIEKGILEKISILPDKHDH